VPSKAEIQKKIKEMRRAAAYCSKLATDLEAMTGVSTPVLKRNPNHVRMEMRAKFNEKYKAKKPETQTA
jgi:hypothetical protein